MRIGRLVILLLAALFATLGLGFWIAPDQAARGFHLHAAGAEGLVSLRADLGGLFLSLAVLAGIGALKRRAAFLLAAAAMLAAVLIGRVIGFVAGHGADPVSFAIEIVALAALLIYARALHADDAARSTITRRVLIGGGSLAIAIVTVAAAVTNAGVQQATFDRASRSLVPSVRMDLLEDDALRIAICGTSGPPPSPSRAKACVMVAAGGKFYVVDAGPESVENLVAWNIPLAQIGGVMITHFHSDHIGDLGELNLQTWVQGRPGPLPVYGGPGIDQVVGGFNQAYRIDQGYRTAHHTAKIAPPDAWPLVPMRVEMSGETRPRSAVVIDEGGLKVTAIEVEHGPVEPAYAYRFDYRGRSVVITGDMGPYPPLAAAVAGVDVLVSEALARPLIETLGRNAAAVGRDRIATIMTDIQNYHVSPTEVAEIANQAQVKLLVYYHLLPAPDNALIRSLFTKGVGEVRRGAWDVADDGSLYTLPIGTDEIRFGSVAD
jgi:ribonuclease Z